MTRQLLSWKTKLSFFTLLIGLLVPTLGFSNLSLTENTDETYNVSPPINCNALIMPGTVTGNQSNCGSFDPTVISNVTLATSAEGPVQYLWMYRNATTGYVWTSTGGMGASYDPGNITETTEYVRCVGLVGCTTFPGETNVITASVFPPFDPSVTVSSDITCNGAMDGTASITVSGGGGPGSYYYQWSNGATTASLTGLAAGTYSVTVTDTNGCSTSGTTTIVEPTALSEVTTSSDVTCHGGNDGSATFTVTGGTAPISILWSDGQTTETATGLIAGMYTVTATDANGCTISSSVTITEPTDLVASSTSTGLSCNTSMNATIDVTVTGGVLPYTYSWDNGATTEDLTALNNGTYTLTVTDANGCTTTEVVTIAASPINCCNLVVPGTIGYDQSNCGPFVPATIISLTPGQNLSGAPLDAVEHVWMYRDATTGGNWIIYNGGITSDTLNPTLVSMTTEFIRCVRNVGCITYPGETNIVTITIYPVPTVALTTVNVTCNGDDDGSIAAAVSGGTSPYTYMWSDGQTTATATGLAPGTYTVTITDANGCTATATSTVTEPDALTEVTTSTNVSCNGGMDGAAMIVVSGGTMPYTYSWTSGQQSLPMTTASISGLMAGTYYVTVTDANGCTIMQMVTITEPTALSEVTTSTNVSCNAGSDGTAMIVVSGGTAPYTYLWSNGDMTASISGLTAGTYTVDVTDANGCMISGTATITEPTALSEVTTSTNVSCNAGSDGTAMIVVSGGTAPYTYMWSDGQMTASATGLTAGTYTVVATDANGCTISGSATITEPTALTEVTTSSDITCFDFNDGTAMIVVSGGTPPYSYMWSTGDMTASVTGLAPGAHSVTATDANGCTISSSVTIVEPTALMEVSTSTNVSCNGGADGTAMTVISGGTAPYTYSWSNGGTTASISGLTAGTYTVTATDANGCMIYGSATVTEPTALTEETVSTDVSCNGGTDGTAGIAVNGGTTPYTYLWSDGQTTASATGLAAGTYTVVVTDANGCTISGSTTIAEPTPLSNNPTVSNVLCHGTSTGYAVAVANGGTAPYTYLWSPDLAITGGATNSNIVGVPAGTYTQVATDANGCTLTTVVTITEPDTLSGVITSTNVSCNDGTDGTATIVVSGGTSPYNIIWNDTWPPTTGNTATNLSAGTYTATVVDDNACVIQVMVTITEPDALTEVTTSTNVSCNGGTDGTAMVAVTGGTMPYTYLWSDGQTTASATGLGAGTYTVDVTDANGCMISGSATITEPTALTEVTTSTNVLCYAGTDGSAMIAVSGGTMPYTYLWSNGEMTASISGLAMGTYSVVATDANGCTISQTVVITQPDVLLGNISGTNISCNGLTDGTVTIAVLGGTMPYTYSWNDPASSTTATVTGLAAGTYTVLVTDANGCTLNKTVTITEPTALAEVTTSTNVSCNAGTDGSAMIAVTGGTMPYTYLWSNGDMTASISGLGAGTYTVDVTDANGCMISGSATITEPTALAEVTASYNVSCNGGADGTASVVISGGTPPYAYDWSNGATTASISGLAAGVYALTVTDANGCIINATATITEPTALAEITTSTNVSCNGGTDGFAMIAASGGTMPYTYLWSNGGTNASISGVAAGTYTVDVTDANGCMISGSATITEPTALTEVTTSTNVMCNAGTDGTAMIVVSGGTMPYTYMWSNQAMTSSISGLTAGTYTVTVTDANGCMISGSATITEPTALTCTSSSTDVSCNSYADGSGTVSVSGGTAPYTYLWSDGQTAATAIDLGPGTYTVVATDANGCTTTCSVTITEPTELHSVASFTDASCFGSCDGTGMTNVTGGAMPYTYSWSTGGTAVAESGLCAGSYTVTTTDANNCLSTAAVVIGEPAEIAVTFTLNTTNGTILATGQNGSVPYTYSWNTGSTSGFLTGAVDGTTYTVTVTDANGCSSSEDILYSTMNPIIINVGPNPFTTSTLMNISSPVSTDVMVDIYDVQGNIVENSYNGHIEANVVLQLTLNGDNIEPGLYFCRVISSEGMSNSKKMLLVK
ncbi:MAG: T9SS type A sorting domain-containing protein [Crocinitomicaceae bacterium]